MWLFIMMPSGLSLRVQDGWLSLPKAVAACLHGENSHLHKTPSSLWETLFPQFQTYYTVGVSNSWESWKPFLTFPTFVVLSLSFTSLNVLGIPPLVHPFHLTGYPYSWEAWFHVLAPASEPKLDTTVDTAQPCKVVLSPCLSLSRLSQ